MFGRKTHRSEDLLPDWFLYIPADEPAQSEAQLAGWTDEEVCALTDRIGQQKHPKAEPMTAQEQQALAEKWTAAAEDLKMRLRGAVRAGEAIPAPQDASNQ